MVWLLSGPGMILVFTWLTTVSRDSPSSTLLQMILICGQQVMLDSYWLTQANAHLWLVRNHWETSARQHGGTHPGLCHWQAVPQLQVILASYWSTQTNTGFWLVRHGDRFWYENGGWPSSFTLEQLSEIRRVKLSRVLCDNSDDLETVQVWVHCIMITRHINIVYVCQVYAMVLPDHEINPRVPCKSGVLPRYTSTLNIVTQK